MKKIPLNYYVNLFITGECITYYNNYNPKGTQSDCFSWFAYVETYIRSNSKLPAAIEQLIMKLIKSLADVYGFNIEKAVECINNYFVNTDYKKYLNFVAIRNEYLESKN